jgi:hypothetical protein
LLLLLSVKSCALRFWSYHVLVVSMFMHPFYPAGVEQLLSRQRLLMGMNIPGSPSCAWILALIPVQLWATGGSIKPVVTATSLATTLACLGADLLMELLPLPWGSLYLTTG